LRDKLSKQTIDTPLTGLAVSSIDQDAITALVALGISRPMAENAIKKVVKDQPSIPLEDIIKQALKNL
ncbi:MAG: Holliday junction branch migration protein RuvA, partial [Chitinophagaceae bacterium]